ncbi:asparagine synthase (glutamine-hydrolyzing) [Streptomyces roseirectus]|uniref:asparagine synthase (glutamine-hydrolyzing) n=1 Tax=Streptomyces roseirectus TaxID=2768066 RepID=A0A7H0I5Q1_9ACTN|nr:asparagine synthase (glutamine-hydrolyzing) [Streptomyces roseirectus]QNP68117.1 asparagine synthase (glutamine-hydrolyzing) [Streptomyces roseirectus]
MCGIFGRVGAAAGAGEVLDAMEGGLLHRGPDSRGRYADDWAALGSRRLSIVDPDGGSQPFTSEDGSVVLVCNGEIYNYAELRARLAGRHVFRSECDVEVIAHLYEELGIGLLAELEGQFAFALYDRVRGVVHLARDPFGICPLYYARDGDGLDFASTARALPAAGRIDLRGLDQVLCLPSVVSPRTLFEGVSSVRPGHRLEVTRDGVREVEYWDLDYPAAEETEESGEFADAGALLGALRTAVRRRLRSDAPVGLYLSGGLDSALVACLAAEVAESPVTHTFSAVFPAAELDERPYQELLARRLGLPHRPVEVTADRIRRDLELAVWHSEVPLRESYNVASLALAEAAAGEGVKVVLTGEGADEFFAGYSGYRFDALRAALPAGRRPPVPQDELRAREAMWGDPSYGYDLDVAALRRAREELYSSELLSSLPEFDCTAFPVADGRRIRGRHPMHKRSYLDVKLRMTDHLLGDHGDRMTMAHSVEGRYPFLDRDVVDLAMRIPPGLKLRGQEEKYVLKRAASRVVPEQVVRREKFPFTAPGSAYLVREAEEFVRDWLAPDTLRRHGVFDAGAVERLCDTYRDPGYDPSTPQRTDWLMIVLTFTMLRESADAAAPCRVVEL